MEVVAKVAIALFNKKAESQAGRLREGLSRGGVIVTFGEVYAKAIARDGCQDTQQSGDGES